MPERKEPLRRFSERVRAKRRELGWSQSELAARAGVSMPLLSLIERRQQNVTMNRAERIAEALGLELREMIADPSSGEGEEGAP